MFTSFSSWLISLSIILATIIIAFLFNTLFKKIFNKADSPSLRTIGRYNFTRHSLIALIYTVGLSTFIYNIPELKTFAKSLLAGAGILAITVGFASQHALSNIISGLFIIIFKPFRINDRIVIGINSGTIEDITLRHTVIRNFQNKRIIIPNSQISDETIINSDLIDEEICQWIEIGIGYESHIPTAKQIMRDCIIKHPFQIDMRTPEELKEDIPEVVIRVVELSDYAVILRAWVWTKDINNAFIMKCDLLEELKETLMAANIDIPSVKKAILVKQD